MLGEVCLFLGGLQLEPFIIGLVFFETVNILSTVVFYLFSSDVQQQQLRDCSDIVKLLQSSYLFIAKGKADPRHRLRETFIILLNLIKSNINDLDPLILKVDLLIKFLKERGERFADIALR